MMICAALPCMAMLGPPAPPQTNNPVPALISMIPNTQPAGSPVVSLVVNGRNFVNGSVLLWNGGSRPTMVFGSTQLLAALNGDDLQSAGTALVTVVNPTPGGGTSNALLFTITPVGPTLTTLSPTTALVASAGFTLTVNGAGFVSGDTVLWNGIARPTTFASPTQLTAAIQQADLLIVGTSAVTVMHPNGGLSAALAFAVTAPPSVMPTAPVLAYLPHVPYRGGFRTKITVVNASPNPNSGVVNLISQTGVLVASVPWSTGGGGTVRIDTSNLFANGVFGNLTVNWAVIGAQAAVSANLFYEYPANAGPYDIANTVGFNDVPLYADLTVPFEQAPQPAGATAGRVLGVAMANPAGAPAAVTVELVDSGGSILAADTIGLGAYSQRIFSLPATALPTISARTELNSEFVGTLTFHSVLLGNSSTPVPLAVIALEDTYGPFSATPIMPFRVK